MFLRAAARHHFSTSGTQHVCCQPKVFSWSQSILFLFSLQTQCGRHIRFLGDYTMRKWRSAVLARSPVAESNPHLVQQTAFWADTWNVDGRSVYGNAEAAMLYRI